MSRLGDWNGNWRLTSRWVSNGPREEARMSRLGDWNGNWRLMSRWAPNGLREGARMSRVGEWNGELAAHVAVGAERAARGGTHEPE
jgi:hypothetical protein